MVKYNNYIKYIKNKNVLPQCIHNVCLPFMIIEHQSVPCVRLAEWGDSWSQTRHNEAFTDARLVGALSQAGSMPGVCFPL